MPRVLLLVVALALLAPAQAAAIGWDPATVPVPPAVRDAFNTRTVATTAGEAVSVWSEGGRAVAGAVPNGPAVQALGGTQVPTLAAGPGGETVAGWVQDRRLLVARRAAGDAAGFGTPVDIGPGPDPGAAAPPKLVVTPDGTTVAAWATGSGVAYASGGPGGWTTPEPVDTKGGYGPRAFAAADGGHAVMAYNAPFDRLMLTTRKPDGTWTPALDIGEGSNDIRIVTVAIDAAGRAVAVWGTHDRPGFGDPRLRAAVSDPDGTWSPVTGLEAAAASTVLLTPPALEVSPRGDVLIAWVGARGTSFTFGDPLQVATGTTAGPAMQATTMDATYKAGVNVLASMQPDGSAVLALATGPFVSFVRQGTGPFAPSVITCDGVKGTPVLLGLAAGPDGTATAVTGATESPALLRRRTATAPEQPAPCPGRPAQPVPAGPGTGSVGNPVEPGSVKAFARQRLKTVLERGLRLAVRYDRGGAVRVDLVLAKATSKRLGLGRRTRVVGTRKVLVKLGTVPVVRVRVTKAKRVRTAIRRAKRLPLQIRVRAGGRTVATQRVTLKR